MWVSSAGRKFASFSEASLEMLAIRVGLWHIRVEKDQMVIEMSSDVKSAILFTT